MKTKIIVLLSSALIFVSCGKKLKTSYNCECKDMWAQVKGHEFEEFEKAWGHYVDKEEDFTAKKVAFKYQITYECGGSSHCGEIWLWFDAYRLEGSPDLLPMNNVHHAYCYSPSSESQRLIP